MTKAYGFTAFGGPETEDWIDLPPQTPGANEVLIDVRAAGVNPVDYKKRGGYGADPNADPAFPQVFGSEAAGVVREVGRDVSHVRPGDEVFGRAAVGSGTYAEQAVLDGNATMTKPVKLGFPEAASVVISAGTAFKALEQLAELGLTEGQSLLVNAAGGSVGVVALQLARDRGVAAFGIASESKRAMVESLGGVLVPYDGDTDVVTQMRELLPGGVDAILDLFGGDSLQEIAVLVKTPSHIASAVDPAVEGLGGFQISHDRPAAMYSEVADLMTAGKIDPKITSSYTFDEAPEALRSVEKGHQLGKIVIDLTQTTQT